jgi:REP element-mobilizing transposase RayT
VCEEIGMEPLTDRQREVLEVIEDSVRRHGFPPTLREIGKRLGLANVNAVRGHVEALEKKGYISKDPDKARSIRTIHTTSVLSRFKRRLHQVFQTDKAVLHKIVYGLAWSTWNRTPYFTGARRTWLEEALAREAVEHGWRLIELRIEADHVVAIVEAWPNHSAQQAVGRLQAAGRKVKMRHLAEFPGKHLWGKGFVATTDLGLLEGLVGQLLGEAGRRDEDGK